MRRFIFITATICFLGSGGVNGGASETTFKGEYRHDAFEYGEEAKDFYRASLLYSYSDLTRCGATYIRDASGETERYTWHLSIASPGGNARLLMGNFYAHFGSGLVVGRSRIYSPDPFGTQAFSSVDRSFSPCKSGDQRYSFHGAALGIGYATSSFSVTVAPFCSFRYRYIHDGDSKTWATSGSISSILGRTKREYPYTTPALICDGGAVAEMKAGRWGVVQVYGIHTIVSSPGNGPILWDLEHSMALRSLSGLGIFVSVREGPLTVYGEGGFAKREVSLESGERREIKGAAFQGGIICKRGFFSFYAKGRTLDKDYYAPYSLGNATPFRKGEGGISLRFDSIALGASFSSEKRLLPLPGDVCAGITNRQRLWIKADLSGRARITVAGRRMEKLEEKREESYQGKISFSLSGKGPFSVNSSFLGQKRGRDGASWSWVIAAGWSWRKKVKISAGYGYVWAGERSPLYVNNAAVFRTPASGSFMKSPAHYFGGGASIAAGGCQGRIQYTHWMDKGKTSSWKIEASAVMRI